jgi:hypothetical protein
MSRDEQNTIGANTARTIAKPRLYFHSHVSLLNDIGNLQLKMGNLHVAFFYFYEAISILSPVIVAAAKLGSKHSGLPSYVDAIIGVSLVYISLAEAMSEGPGSFRSKPPNQRNEQLSVDVPSNADDIAANILFAFQAMLPMCPVEYSVAGELVRLNGTTPLIASDMTENPSQFDITRRPISRINEDDLRRWGLDHSSSFKDSISTLAKRLDGVHQMQAADDQLHEAVRVVRECDNGRSVHLIPLMHMQCRIALVLRQKKTALHLMQKCLGLTYWYRNGASDAYALAIYSHEALARIRHAILRDDSAVRIQRWFWRRIGFQRAAKHYRRVHEQQKVGDLNGTAFSPMSKGSGRDTSPALCASSVAEDSPSDTVLPLKLPSSARVVHNPLVARAKDDLAVKAVSPLHVVSLMDRNDSEDGEESPCHDDVLLFTPEERSLRLQLAKDNIVDHIAALLHTMHSPQREEINGESCTNGFYRVDSR